MSGSDPITQLIKNLVAAELIMAIIGLFFAIGMFALWFAPLVHCIKHRKEPDRMMWVMITFLGGPIGGILYLMLGKSTPPAVPPVIPLVTLHLAPDFDHAAMQDDKARARAIENELWGLKH